MSDDFEKLLFLAFGENESVAYGKGKYKYNWGNKLGVLEDTFAKDMCMVALSPIMLGLCASIAIPVGLILMTYNIIPAIFKNRENQTNVMIGFTAAVLGLGFAMLAVISPIARAYNMASRSYASVASPQESLKARMAELDPDKKGDGNEFNIEDFSI